EKSCATSLPSAILPCRTFPVRPADVPESGLPTMTARAVHWHEGMFLRPQHLQAAQRHTAHLSTVGDKWDLHYNWGLRDIDLDLEALANHRLVVRSLRARLRDGTLVSVPEDGLLPAVEL